MNANHEKDSGAMGWVMRAQPRDSRERAWKSFVGQTIFGGMVALMKISGKCHSEPLKQADGLAGYWLMNIPRPCHSERPVLHSLGDGGSEESIRMCAGGCADGFFTSFFAKVYPPVAAPEATRASAVAKAMADKTEDTSLRMTNMAKNIREHP